MIKLQFKLKRKAMVKVKVMDKNKDKAINQAGNNCHYRHYHPGAAGEAMTTTTDTTTRD